MEPGISSQVRGYRSSLAAASRSEALASATKLHHVRGTHLTGYSLRPITRGLAPGAIDRLRTPITIISLPELLQPLIRPSLFSLPSPSTSSPSSRDTATRPIRSCFASGLRSSSLQTRRPTLGSALTLVQPPFFSGLSAEISQAPPSTSTRCDVSLQSYLAVAPIDSRTPGKLPNLKIAIEPLRIGPRPLDDAAARI